MPSFTVCFWCWRMVHNVSTGSIEFLKLLVGFHRCEISVLISGGISMLNSFNFSIFSYGIAVSDPQHIVRVPDWPTISNTGSFPPESCIFSQIFNLCAFLGYFVSLTYYKYVQANGYYGKLNLGKVSIDKRKFIFYKVGDPSSWFILRTIWLRLHLKTLKLVLLLQWFQCLV